MSLSISIKTIINKNWNKIFRKKIFQLLLIISIMYLLSMSIKTIINKIWNKIFRKKIFQFLLIILLIISIKYLY